MQIEVTQEGHLKLSVVYALVIFENERGEKISVCQRDGGFEIVVIEEMTRVPPLRLVRIIE